MSNLNEEIASMLNGSVSGQIEFKGGGGTSNYNELVNKPKINNVELTGNKTTEDLGLFDGDYDNLTNKPTIPPAPVIMVGATTETDGASGYVPQPLTSDVDKFLNGSGEWAEIPLGENEYKTTETIIGKWFDNSNIYRIVYDFRSSPITLSTGWNNTNINSSNINLIINITGLNADGTRYNIEGDPTRSNHTLVGLRGSGTLSYLVLEYTKINN